MKHACLTFSFLTSLLISGFSQDLKKEMRVFEIEEDSTKKLIYQSFYDSLERIVSDVRLDDFDNGKVMLECGKCNYKYYKNGKKILCEIEHRNYNNGQIDSTWKRFHMDSSYLQVDSQYRVIDEKWWNKHAETKKSIDALKWNLSSHIKYSYNQLDLLAEEYIVNRNYKRIFEYEKSRKKTIKLIFDGVQESELSYSHKGNKIIEIFRDVEKNIPPDKRMSEVKTIFTYKDKLIQNEEKYVDGKLTELMEYYYYSNGNISETIYHDLKLKYTIHLKYEYTYSN